MKDSLKFKYKPSNRSDNEVPIWDKYKPLFDVSMNISAEKPVSRYMRSIFAFAGPIDWDGERYDNATDRRGDQTKIFREHLMDDY